MDKKQPLQYALDLLKLRDRTEAEISQKMQEKEYSAAEIGTTVNWLKAKKFLDDERFVGNYLKSQSTNLKSGKRKIFFKLARLGISKETFEYHWQEISEPGEYEKAIELGQRWLIKKGDTDKRYEKLGLFLANKGYEMGVIKKVLSELL